MKYPVEKTEPEKIKKEPLKERLAWFWNEEGGREIFFESVYVVLFLALVSAPFIALLFK